MADNGYTITLSSKEADSGPYYDIYYSSDCINYTIVSGGTNVYLPAVGSSITIGVPDTTTCLKLVNKSVLCNGNSVETIVNTTTTTSTTTTSTTSTSTTTTTTINPCEALLTSSLYALWTRNGYNSTNDTWTDNINGIVADVNGKLTSSACGDGWIFDGTNNYVTFPNTSIFDDNRLIMWAYIEVPTGSNSRAIFAHPYNIEGSNGWDLLFTSNGANITYRPGGFGADNGKAISTAVGNFGMFAAVAYATNSYALYENGSQIGTTSNQVSTNTNGGNFYFGYNQNVDALPFKGTVRAFGLSLGLASIPSNATIASVSACITGSQSSQPCTTTTTSTTSTTTTTITYDFYDAEYYDCLDCGAGPQGTILVCFPSGQSVTLNRFYQPIGGPDGLAYRVTGTASPGVAYILTNAFGSTTTCALACSV